MFRSTLALAAAVLVLALLAAGCGSSDDGGSATASDYRGTQAAAPAPVKSAARTPAPASTAAQAPAAGSPAATPLAVGVGDNVFKPATVQATVGQTITWTLHGAISHTVTASAGTKFDSGALQPGQSFSWTPRKAGTVAYLCAFHAGMTGTIVVR